MIKSISAVIAMIIWGHGMAENGDNSLKANFKKGSPEIGSIKALALGPDNVLFIGDNRGMKIIAIDIAKPRTGPFNGPVEVKELDLKLAGRFGVAREAVKVEDLVVNPVTSTIYFSASLEINKGKEYVLMTISDEGRLEEFSLKEISYDEIVLEDAPGVNATLWNKPSRTYTITDMAYADNELIVSGLSNEEFASSLRRIPFPFKESFVTTGLQVYHVSHGRNETHAPVYRFLPYRLNNRMHIIAGYMCTPLVSFEVPSLVNGGKVVGKTIAELGAGNAPTGIIDYEYKGKSYILVGNNRHPLMKFKPEDIAKAKGIKLPSRERGVSREKFSEGKIYQIADLNEDYIVVLNQDKVNKSLHLRSIAKESL